MTRKIDIIGKRFGRLTIINEEGNGGNNKQLMIKVKCDCGTIKTIRKSSIIRKIKPVVSCGCYHIEQTKKSNSFIDDSAVMNIIYRQYKNNAKRKQILFNLSKEQVYLLIQQKCHYCKNIPNRNVKSIYKSSRGILYNGIDRVDNNIGYLIGNVVSCCKICNYAKHNQTYDEFVAYLKRVSKIWYE